MHPQNSHQINKVLLPPTPPPPPVPRFILFGSWEKANGKDQELDLCCHTHWMDPSQFYFFSRGTNSISEQSEVTIRHAWYCLISNAKWLSRAVKQQVLLLLCACLLPLHSVIQMATSELKPGFGVAFWVSSELSNAQHLLYKQNLFTSLEGGTFTILHVLAIPFTCTNTDFGA